MRVVGALDGGVFVRVRQFCREEIHQRRIDAGRDWFVWSGGIPVDRKPRNKIACSFLMGRKAGRCLRTAPREKSTDPCAIGLARGEPGPFLILVRRAVNFIGSANFRHHVDEATGTASEFGGRTIGHHLELLNRVKVHCEEAAFVLALLAEKRIIVICSVNGDVVIDTLLAVNRDLVAVRPLQWTRRLGQSVTKSRKSPGRWSGSVLRDWESM